jgi:hypothetical protein
VDRMIRCCSEGKGAEDLMAFLRFLRIWTALSVPAGILIGKLLQANRRTTTRPMKRR